MSIIHDDNGSGGYPKGSPIYEQPIEKTLTHKDHFVDNRVSQPKVVSGINPDKSFFYDDHKIHFTRDVNDNELKDKPTTNTLSDGTIVPVFSGSTTAINPTDDPAKAKIMEYGLESAEIERTEKINNGAFKVNLPPISPLQPFTRMDPYTAQVSNLTTYNRAKLPVADLEFRKGFRHIFFTRPECYIMAHNPNGITPIMSEQAEYDEDFSSASSRMPHILNMLSPIYVTGSFSQNNINSNFNYLLSNRVMGLTTTPIQLTINENGVHSVEGYVVTPGMHVETRHGSSIDLSFRDTKNLEIYEMMRLWMLYIYKRKKGIFTPSYNGYQYKNGFMTAGNDGSPLPNHIIYHPYDRALDYCASLFDIVTNESMTKIIYWCKYYGVFPTSVDASGLTNSNNGPMVNEMSVSTTFKYQYRLENVNKTLVEFNYNAGITDDMGRLSKEVGVSHPFLLQENLDEYVLKPNYIGAAGMFTGSPYIIMNKSQKDPLNGGNTLIAPCLQFMPLNDTDLNRSINLGITNNVENPKQHIIHT